MLLWLLDMLQPGTPSGRPFEAPTPGAGWAAPTPGASFSEAGTPTDSAPSYGNLLVIFFKLGLLPRNEYSLGYSYVEFSSCV